MSIIDLNKKKKKKKKWKFSGEDVNLSWDLMWNWFKQKNKKIKYSLGNPIAIKDLNNNNNNNNKKWFLSGEHVQLRGYFISNRFKQIKKKKYFLGHTVWIIKYNI